MTYYPNPVGQIPTLLSFGANQENYSNPDDDPRGRWRAGDVRNALYRPNLIYTVRTPSGNLIAPPENGWRWSEETLLKKIDFGEIIFSSDEQKIIRKIYLAEQEGRAPETIWFGSDVGTTRKASNELKELFDGKVPFDTAKPTGLIERLIQISALKATDICLDFFAGSCSTAQSVMQSSQAKFICVQLPEDVPEDSPHGKAAIALGFTDIAKIGAERIRRAIKYSPNANVRAHNGFKLFKLSNSNILPWHPDASDDIKASLFDNVDNIRHDRSEADVLSELLLKYGLDLAVPIEERDISGKTVHVIGAGALVVCLADAVDLDLVNVIASLKAELAPEVMRVVFKDNGFADDVVKTNAVQILRQAGVDDVKSL